MHEAGLIWVMATVVVQGSLRWFSFLSNSIMQGKCGNPVVRICLKNTKSLISLYGKNYVNFGLCFQLRAIRFLFVLLFLIFWIYYAVDVV